MIVDGRAIARDILRQTREGAKVMPDELVVRAIVLAPSAATESYLSIKQRRARDAAMFLDIVRIENDATEEELIRKIQLPGAAGVIVQLPLPPTINAERVLDAIPEVVDADVLSSAARAAYNAQEMGALLPPVVGAIAEILERASVEVRGKRAVVVGNGWLVGTPVAAWLTRQGAHVAVIDKDDSLAPLKDAQLIVSGAGSPHLIKPEMLTRGVVLIDAGTSESDGAIVGDADPACAEVASVFTPVPGGVGPIAVACLFRNVLALAKRDGLPAA